MRNTWIFATTALLSLAACNQDSEVAVRESVAIDGEAEAPANEFGFWEAREGSSSPERAVTADIAEPSPDATATVTPQDAVATPQIAYHYAMGFRLPADAIKPLQSKHADMCEARGSDVCRIISMRQAEQDGNYAYGSLQIAVAANAARGFSKELEASSGNSDAKLVSSSIEGEDLSKAIVDTEAKLRARTLLRDRLMKVLRNRKGTVAELVEAERGVAQVNQEIDQARSWLNEMRGRVAFSQMSISYESGARSSGGFSEPIRNAWNSLGAIFGSMIAFFMLAFALIAPLALIGFGAWRTWQHLRKDQSGPAESA